MKVLLALPLLLATAGAALANDKAAADVTIPSDAILLCRALGDTAARLACYDAIPVGDAGTPALAAAPAPAPVPAPARASAPTAEQSFGMETVRKAESETPKFIESTIPGNFQGWGPSTQFTLANGQVWRVVDGSEAVLAPVQDVKVRIVRNFFGTTFLEVAGTNNSPTVRRVR